MKQYAVLIEAGPDNLSAYVPSLPGCVATGADRKEVLDNLYEAIQMHIEGMIEDGEQIPDDIEALYLEVPDSRLAVA